MIAEAEAGVSYGDRLRNADADVFSSVSMSTQHTGARDQRRRWALGDSAARLPRLRDFDTQADARLVEADGSSSEFARPPGEVDAEMAARLGPRVGAFA